MTGEEKILAVLEQHGQILNALVTKVDKLESDVAVLKQDVAVLKQDMADTKQAVIVLDRDMNKMNAILENHTRMLQMLVDIAVRQDGRISPLEKKVYAL